MKIKRILSFFIIIGVIVSTMSFGIYAGGTPGEPLDPKDMDYRDGCLTYTINAPRGNKVVYSTVGFSFYFFSNKYEDSKNNPLKYETIVSLDPSWQTKIVENPDGTNTATWAIPFKQISKPTDITANTIISRMLDKYKNNPDYHQEIINFFNRGGTIYLDQVFTVKENGKPLGTLHYDGTYTGEIYFDESSIKAARSWSRTTMLAFNQYYGRYCRFEPQNILEPPLPVISRDKPSIGSVINSSTNFNISNDILLYADRSIWPDYASDKYYKWEYKLTSASGFTTLTSGKGKVAVTFPKLNAGSYNVKLTEWYATLDGIEHPDMKATKEVTLHLDDAGVTITPTVDADKVITQAQVDANEIISVNVSGLAKLLNCSDPSKISKWVIHMRKDPAGADSQYEQFTFTSNLKLTQSANKIFKIPASVLKNSNSYTQNFVLKAVATVSGTEVSSNLIDCSFTLSKETNNPVAVLTAPSSTMAGEVITLSGEKSYSQNGSIVAYEMSIPDTSWNSQNVTAQTALPYGKESYNVTLTVTDNLGLQDSVTKTISVSAPTPAPAISASGKLKENRIAYFSISDFYDLASIPHMYGVDYTKTTWTIKAVEGTGATDSSIIVVDHVDADPLKVTGNSYAAGLLNGIRKIPIWFKNPGEYDVTGTLVNSLGMRGSITKRYTVSPDEEPIVKYTMLDTIHRDTFINGSFHAIITVTDESYSPDGDFIQYRKIYAIYDANNNKVFGDSEDEIILIDESSDSDYIENNRTFSIPVRDVGKYEIHVYVKEGFVP